MKIYDVTMKIDEQIQVYKNIESKKPIFKTVADFKENGHHETDVTFNVHTGTHIDFPLHMIEGGKNSTSLDIHRFIREVKVFDLSHVNECITKSDVENLNIQEGDFVLFKTKNSFEETFNFHFIFVREDAATYLASKKIRGVGVDGLGIERDQKGHPTHLVLMHQDIDIIEGLRLKEVKEGTYFMYALAVPFLGLDALPMSIILVTHD